MPKNLVYKLKTLVKWRSEIVFPRIPFEIGLVAKQLIIYSRWLPRLTLYKSVRLGLKGYAPPPSYGLEIYTSLGGLIEDLQ